MFFSYYYLIRADNTAGSVKDPLPVPVKRESSPDYRQQCSPSEGNQRAALHRHNTERRHSVWLNQPHHHTTYSSTVKDPSCPLATITQS